MQEVVHIVQSPIQPNNNLLSPFHSLREESSPHDANSSPEVPGSRETLNDEVRGDKDRRKREDETDKMIITRGSGRQVHPLPVYVCLVSIELTETLPCV